MFARHWWSKKSKRNLPPLLHESKIRDITYIHFLSIGEFYYDMFSRHQSRGNQRSSSARSPWEHCVQVRNIDRQPRTAAAAAAGRSEQVSVWPPTENKPCYTSHPEPVFSNPPSHAFDQNNAQWPAGLALHHAWIVPLDPLGCVTDLIYENTKLHWSRISQSAE